MVLMKLLLLRSDWLIQQALHQLLLDPRHSRSSTFSFKP